MDVERIRKRFHDIEIRPYQESARTQLEALAAEMHAESMFSRMELNMDKVIRHWSLQHHMQCFRVAVRNGVVLGAVYGYATSTFFSDEMFAHVKGIWVKSEHRGSAAFILLLDSFEQWARDQGAILGFLDQTTALDIERSMNLFEGCGYRLIGVNSVKEL